MSAPERRVSCSASPVGCLLWLGIFFLVVGLVSWVAAMWGAR